MFNSLCEPFFFSLLLSAVPIRIFFSLLFENALNEQTQHENWIAIFFRTQKSARLSNRIAYGMIRDAIEKKWMFYECTCIDRTFFPSHNFFAINFRCIFHGLLNWIGIVIEICRFKKKNTGKLIECVAPRRMKSVRIYATLSSLNVQ